MTDQSTFSSQDLARAFVVVAVVEACTWAALLFGMFLKYVTDTTEAGVQVAGPIHGMAFIAYITVAWLTASRLGWSGRTRLVALAAGIPPFGSIVFERWAMRRGMLSV